MNLFFEQQSLFDPFSHYAGLSLAECASLVYEESTFLLRRIRGIADVVEVFDKGDTAGFIAVGEEFLILSFRGTDHFRDWLYNIRVLPTAHEMGEVHRGFDTALTQVWKGSILPVLREYAVGRRVWYTGHSLGGVLATLAAARTHHQIPDASISGIVTFGQPRLASRQFEENFNRVFKGRFHRYVNNVDIIPHIPPGYQHVGELIHFDCNGCIVSPGSGNFEALGRGDVGYDDMTGVEFEEILSALDSLPELGNSRDPFPQQTEVFLEGTFRSPGIIKGIRDHSMINGYIPALLNNL